MLSRPELHKAQLSIEASSHDPPNPQSKTPPRKNCFLVTPQRPPLRTLRSQERIQKRGSVEKQKSRPVRFVTYRPKHCHSRNSEYAIDDGFMRNNKTGQQTSSEGLKRDLTFSPRFQDTHTERLFGSQWGAGIRLATECANLKVRNRTTCTWGDITPSGGPFCDVVDEQPISSIQFRCAMSTSVAAVRKYFCHARKGAKGEGEK